jgi:RNA polymerase sigma-70 factor (ECF subfamily)
MALAVEIQLQVAATSQNQTPLTDLIERAASGDTAAFEQIMIHSQHRVMAMTWRMLGNEADARDASQEVFLKVYRYLGRFDQNQDFFAWLYTITLNVCRDIGRQRSTNNDRFKPIIGDVGDKAYEIHADQADAEQVSILSQQREMIAKAMAMLPQKERAAIVLRDVEGLSTDEVARILNSSSTTVRSQISSARKKIKIYCDQYVKNKRRRTTDEL